VSVDSDSESENEDVTASKNQTVDSPSKFNSSKSVCSPAPHDIAAVEGATVLRRSLRKVIEESKKDAVCSDSRRYSPQQFAGGSKRTRRKRLSAPSNCEQGVDISKDLKVASDENSPVQLDSAFCKKRLLTKKARAQSLKTKRSKVESSFQSATDQTVGNGVDAMDSSEKSSVSSVGIPKKPACIASSRSFESKLELTHLFGESETNSIDSDVVGMETSDSLIQSRLRTSGTSSPGNDHQKNDEKIGDFAAFRDTVKQENTDCDISTADNGSSITEQSFCQKSAIKQDLLSRDASVAKQHCERDDTLNDEMAEHKASNTDTKPDAASSLNFDASEDTKTAISENMLSEEKRPANFPVLSELESCNETSELKLFGDVTHRLKKAVDAEISLTDLAEDERELKQLNISEEEVTLENEKMSDKIMEDRNLSESKKGNVRTPEDEKVECCLGLTKENMENGDDVEKVENRPEPIKEDPPEILVCHSCNCKQEGLMMN
jgi:hypothetical protein